VTPARTGDWLRPTPSGHLHRVAAAGPGRRVRMACGKSWWRGDLTATFPPSVPRCARCMWVAEDPASGEAPPPPSERGTDPPSPLAGQTQAGPGCEPDPPEMAPLVIAPAPAWPNPVNRN
jgi:hypothetical protein